MPRLRHHWGGSTSSAAIAAVARAEQEERESSSSGDGEEKDATSRELDVYAVLRELLEVHLLLGGQIKNGRSGFKGNERNREADWEASVRDQDGGEGEGLGEFIEYLANEIWQSLAPALQNGNTELGNIDVSNVDTETLIAGTPAAVIDSLQAYGFLPSESEDASTSFLQCLYSDLLSTIVDTTASTRTSADPPTIAACELCDRAHVPLTVHHLIPRQVHAKAVKRGWVLDLEECQTRIAWLCRACHSFVHRIARNEELAQRWNTIEKLEERQDVRRWAHWVANVRWKKR